MSESRAEYYREYRRRKKQAQGSTESEFVVTVLHDVVQQLQQTVQQLRDVVQQLQHVAQQKEVTTGSVSANNSECLERTWDTPVAQQSQQNVAQQKKSKRKGSFPPSFPPSHPPQTPPYSSPLLSPQPRKEKPREIFEISSGQEFSDNPEAPLLEQGRGQQRDIATFADLQEAAKFVWEETQSDSLQDAFYDWIEYKQERGPKEFYTRKGLLAEGKHFVRKHFEDFNVVRAVEKAIASNWQGWDHK